MLSIRRLDDSALALWVPTHVALCRHCQRGASLTEYALLVALLAATCIASIDYVGSLAGDKLRAVGSSVGQP